MASAGRLYRVPTLARAGTTCTESSQSVPEMHGAVGQRVGETDPDQTLIEHWDGTSWSVVASPRHATASAALYSAGGRGDAVVAVGETVDPLHGGEPLVERLMNDRALGSRPRSWPTQPEHPRA